jgi:hypothetical protein
MNYRHIVVFLLVAATAFPGQAYDLYRSITNGSYTNCAIWEGSKDGKFEPLFNSSNNNCSAVLTAIQSADLVIRHDIVISSASFVSVNRNITVEKGKLTFSNTAVLQAEGLTIRVKKGATVEFRKGLRIALGRVAIWAEPGAKVIFNDFLDIAEKGVTDPALEFLPWAQSAPTTSAGLVLEDGALWFTKAGKRNMTISSPAAGRLTFTGDLRIGENGPAKPALWQLNNLSLSISGNLAVAGSPGSAAFSLESAGAGRLDVSGNVHLLAPATMAFRPGTGLSVGKILTLGNKVNPGGNIPADPAQWPVKYALDWQRGELSVKGQIRVYSYSRLRIGIAEGASVQATGNAATPGLQLLESGLLGGRDLLIDRMAQVQVNDRATIFGKVYLGFNQPAGAKSQYLFGSQVERHDPEAGVPEVEIGGKGCRYWQGPDGSVSCTENIPLAPVLEVFTAEEVKKGVELRWTVRGEEFSRQYTLERSADGISFAQIGKVNAKGRETASYVFTDTKAVGPVVVYRLQQVLFNGIKNELGTIAVQLSTGALWTLYPNPYTGGNLSLSAEGLTPNRMTVFSIRDLNGKTRFTADFLPDADGRFNAVVASGLSLQKGVYLAILMQEGVAFTSLLKVE